MIQQIQQMVRSMLSSPLGQFVAGAVAFSGLLVLGALLLIQNIVGLSVGLSALIFGGTLLTFAVTGGCLYAASTGMWKSGKTVGTILILLWVLIFVYWEGTRAFLFGAEIYQWSFSAKWGMYFLAWIAAAAAGGIWVTLVYKGPKILVWTFVIASALVTSFALVDKAQYTDYRSPFSGELMVKACPGFGEDHSHPIPLAAKSCREHQFVEEEDFQILSEMPKEDRKILLMRWSGYQVDVGDQAEDLAARKDCAVKKAAARNAGQPEPECSVNGVPSVSVPSMSVPAETGDYTRVYLGLCIGIPALLGLAFWGGGLTGRLVGAVVGGGVGVCLAMFLGSVSDGGDILAMFRASSSFPAELDLAAGKGEIFRVDLGSRGHTTSVVWCEGNPGAQLQVRNGKGRWVQQQLQVGIQKAVDYDNSVDAGARSVEFRNNGATRSVWIVGQGKNLAAACPQGTTGYMVGRVKDVAEQSRSAGKNPTATPAAPPSAPTEENFEAPPEGVEKQQ